MHDSFQPIHFLSLSSRDINYCEMQLYLFITKLWNQKIEIGNINNCFSPAHQKAQTKSK